MRFPVLSRFLFALGLLMVQTLALVHATGHELKPEKAAVCEICDLAHLTGGTPAVADASKIVAPRSEEPAIAIPAAVPRRTLARPRSRAPPFRLV
jgi:hypothetical protein